MEFLKSYEELLKTAKDHGQEHIFRFWNELNSVEQEQLLSQVSTIDFSFIDGLYKKALQEKEEETYENIQAPDVIIKSEHTKENEEAMQKGIDAIKEGRVALFTLAGGQGSRLGFEGPKGCFPITPVMNKPLFQVFAEKLLATNRQYNTELEWYLMTSEANHKDTIAFFEEQNYFGLNKEHVIFFKQRMLPQIDEEGKILLAKKHELVMGPDGHGGIFNAFVDNGITQRMKEKKIHCFMLITMDNPLTPCIDPMYLGHHLLKDAQYSVKVTKKAYPEERVGHVVKINGVTQMVEYIALNEEQIHERDEQGELVFSSGNLLNDILNVDFVEKVEKENLLEYVAAHKKSNYLDENGNVKETSEPNSYKFERFIFDALPLAKNTTVFEVIREEEFAPVKNAQGKDSPQSARGLQTELYRSWLAGVIDDERLLESLEKIEVSPLFAIDREHFVKKIQANIPRTVEKLQESREVYFGCHSFIGEREHIQDKS